MKFIFPTFTLYLVSSPLLQIRIFKRKTLVHPTHRCHSTYFAISPKKIFGDSVFELSGCINLEGRYFFLPLISIQKFCVLVIVFPHFCSQKIFHIFHFPSRPSHFSVSCPLSWVLHINILMWKCGSSLMLAQMFDLGHLGRWESSPDANAWSLGYILITITSQKAGC